MVRDYKDNKEVKHSNSQQVVAQKKMYCVKSESAQLTAPGEED